MMTEYEKRKVEAIEAVATALRDIGAAMHLSYLLDREIYRKNYPEKKEVRDALITRPETAEDKARKNQGATDETDEEWIGRREQKVLATEEARRQKKGRTT